MRYLLGTLFLVILGNVFLGRQIPDGNSKSTTPTAYVAKSSGPSDKSIQQSKVIAADAQVTSTTQRNNGEPSLFAGVNTFTEPGKEQLRNKEGYSKQPKLRVVGQPTKNLSLEKANEDRVYVYVERVLDGDTVKVLSETEIEGEYTVRLHGIDAPESSQPFGLDATNLLRQYTIGKTIQIQVKDVDRYGRKVGVLYTKDGESINEKLVRNGMAWHYLKYDKSASYSLAEALARKARIGIWSQQQQIAPWDYRNGVRVETSSPVNAPSTRTTDQVVFITQYGSKYHRDGCKHLAKSRQEIPLSRAKSAYDPCKNCQPPF